MKKIIVACLCCLSVACSNYASVGEKFYQDSRNGPKLVVPAPLTDTNISHFYDLPEPNQNTSVSIEPKA